ncbi:MAG: hypothetical protein AUI14_04920 [Actinobacteria bacterium 13_2_20CM_2_71_6]|nr:MAG: hypothetical protein AUI14_04920 [Actinobacteria bacterium 13_2_20CM_2_71_6]
MAQLITLVVPSDEQHLLVVVTRGVRTWRADIPDLDTAWQMRSLAEIHRSVRSLLGPEWVNYEFRTGDRRLLGVMLAVSYQRIQQLRRENAQ